MKISIINGPNINMLGIREQNIYGNETYQNLIQAIKDYSNEKGFEPIFYQSNHEGDLVDYIQGLYKKCDGIVINPAAYTHYSIAILDALKSIQIPYVEVHLSNIDERESFRKVSITGTSAVQIIKGQGFYGYLQGIDTLMKYFS